MAKSAADTRTELTKLSDEELAQQLREALSKNDKAKYQKEFIPEVIGQNAFNPISFIVVAIALAERFITRSSPVTDEEESAGQIRRLLREAERRGYKLPKPRNR